MTFIDDVMSGIMPDVMGLVGASATLLRTGAQPTDNQEPPSYTFGFAGGAVASASATIALAKSGDLSWAVTNGSVVASLSVNDFKWMLSIQIVSNNDIYIWTADSIENALPPTDPSLWDVDDNNPSQGDVLQSVSIGTDQDPRMQSFSCKTTPPQDYVEANASGQLMKSLRTFTVMDDTTVEPDPTTDDIQIGSRIFDIDRVDPVMSGVRAVGWYLYLKR